MFFSKFYKKVIGIDASTQIIAKNKKFESTKKNTVFLLNDLSNENILIDSLNNELSEIKDCIFYARFFLHAINEDTENKLLNLYKVCKNNNLLALEFRTRDKKLKNNLKSFQRFIDLNHLVDKMETTIKS